MNILTAPAAALAFQKLRIGAAVHCPVAWWGSEWWTIHLEPGVQRFEDQYGAEAARARYNVRNLAAARRQKKTIHAQHTGHSDLFVPILVEGKAAGVFAFLRSTLNTPVLEDQNFARFVALFEHIARLMAGDSTPTLTSDIYHLIVELEQTRNVDHVWNAIAGMVDESAPQLWESTNYTWELKKLGLSRPANQALVGLAVSRDANRSPVEDAIRLDAFQRASVGLAREVGEAVAGRVGDHGVVR